MTQADIRLSTQERQQQAVAVVTELVSELSPGEITTTDVARRMGVTQGALFRHFPSKDALWEAVMQHVRRQMLARLQQIRAEQPDPMATLQAMFLAHAEFAALHPGVPRMLFGQMQHSGHGPAKRIAQELLREYRAQLQQVLEQGQQQQVLPATLDCEAAAWLFIGTLQGLVMQSLLAGDTARIRRQAPQLYAIFERGIRCH